MAGCDIFAVHLGTNHVVPHISVHMVSKVQYSCTLQYNALSDIVIKGVWSHCALFAKYTPSSTTTRMRVPIVRVDGESSCTHVQQQHDISSEGILFET